jgi:hypothetical protein
MGDPQECRARALYCAKRAAGCTSQVARQRFANMAKVWMQLAIQLEDQLALLDRWGDYRNAETHSAERV